MPKQKNTGLGGIETLFKSPAEEPEPPAEETVTASVQKKSAPPKSTIQENPQEDDLGPLRQTTIMLYDREMDWLDQKVLEVRKKGGNKTLSKTALIRALINLAITSPVDLKGTRSEADLVKRFEQAVKNK